MVRYFMEKVGLDVKGNSGKVVFTDSQDVQFPTFNETSSSMNLVYF